MLASDFALRQYGPLSAVVFPASSLGVWAAGSATVAGAQQPTRAADALAASGVAAVLDGPMFSLLQAPSGVGEAQRYAGATAAAPDYLVRDRRSGLAVPSRYPTRGLTIAVTNGAVSVASGSGAPDAAEVAIQLYPPLVVGGQAVASDYVNTDVTWRAALVVIDANTLAFAVGQMSLADFARALVQYLGAIAAGYTDGGGSGVAATAGGARAGSSENRPVPIWLTAAPGGGPVSSALPWLLGIAAAVAVAYVATRPPKTR